ncbi:dipeptide ABC transporter ATP-binding protein [Iocasia frigidifontis]|uniref:Dipeptide ABC transporter ATP-binding protein n=1 Tax=Iocasia fonsfrigidae TaxID=2682810 RepID=A0A8A7K5H7_9FIRM|nr:dipeptide ABC transporter ATP-binding protein [Iocasia fonsfrigidae]QTL97023.1 dipeptide ABC transporter ATP-binding protein [Iocasia fonsfrigidae]
MAVTENKILEVKNLKKYFPVKAGIFRKTVAHVKAVDDVSFDIYEGETLGLVGESGCGKSTTGSTILRLLEATSGEVSFKGEDILSLNRNKLRTIRKEMQMIFQDPYASLNPRMTVADIVGEPLKIHDLYNKKSDRDEKVKELLESVGLTAEQMNRYPHEFSGGQRQRIGVARALAVDPKLIIADEPVSALDVSVQAQVINILQDLQKEFGLTYLFIAHDLSVVKHISNRVAVMYLGKIVEITNKSELYDNPLHPYTQALLSAIPEPNPERKKERTILEGDVPSPVNPPSGCSFHPRCPAAMDICSKVEPEFKDYGNGHFASCLLLD